MNLGNTGRPGAGFGFVTFAKEEAAREALQNKDNIFFNKLQLNIEEKKTRVSFILSSDSSGMTHDSNESPLKST